MSFLHSLLVRFHDFTQELKAGAIHAVNKVHPLLFGGSAYLSVG